MLKYKTIKIIMSLFMIFIVAFGFFVPPKVTVNSVTYYSGNNFKISGVKANLCSKVGLELGFKPYVEGNSTIVINLREEPILCLLNNKTYKFLYVLEENTSNIDGYVRYITIGGKQVRKHYALKINGQLYCLYAQLSIYKKCGN